MKMVQESTGATAYLDMEESSCFSKSSGDESNSGPTSHNFSSDFCGDKDYEMPSSEEEETCRKKRCSDRYDSAESSDSGIAVSSGSSSLSGTSDITDPGSPFSTASDDSGHGKSSSCPVGTEDFGSPIMAPSVADCPVSLSVAAAICPKTKLATRSPLFPQCRAVRAQRSGESRVKRRFSRFASPVESQGKITEYFKTQSKPMVGIKRDFNYLKKESFAKVASLGVDGKITEESLMEMQTSDDSSDSPFALKRLRTSAKTLFNKILHNHKQRKLVENIRKARTEPKPVHVADTQPKKTDTPLYVDCGAGSSIAVNPKSPILTVPKTIRFPATGRKANQRDKLECRWDNCTTVCDASGPLLEHLQTSHVVTQCTGEKFVCLWVGCKVYSQKSCSRSWLERHILIHAGNKPYRCIVDGCGLSFSSQSMLNRHVNHHFPLNSKKQLDNSGGQKTVRKASKKVRWRLQPLAARTHDYFDEGKMQGLRHRFFEMNRLRTDGDIENSQPHCITLRSEICGTRYLPTGQKEFLLRWHPLDVVEDEWVNVDDVRPHQYVPYHKIPNAVKSDLVHEWGLFRPGVGGRKMKPVPPPPPSLPSPPLVECLPRVDVSPPTVEQFLSHPIPTQTHVLPPVAEKVKLKRKRSSAKIKSPIDLDSLPVVTIPVVDIAKTKQSQEDGVSSVAAPFPVPTPVAAPAPTPSTSFILNSQPFKLVSQPFLNAVLPVTYQLQPQLQSQMQQPLYFLPPSSAPMFQTIHFSSNIVQQQSILATMNIQKSPTLLLLNTSKQVNVNLTQERPKQKVQILPKPECLMSIRPS